MQLFSLSYPTADTLVALEHDVCVGGVLRTLCSSVVHRIVLYYQHLYVCMYVSGVC